MSVPLVILGLELGIRVFAPANAFLDRRTDCYWVMRIAERARRDSGPRTISNVAIHRELGWIMQAGYDVEGERVNSRGVRSDLEIPYERVEGRRRLVALGDSFTFGLGVANGETYVDLLERELEDLETVNLGVNGHGTDQQLLYWEAEGVKYAPDLVLLGFYVPDFHRNALGVRELAKPRFSLEDGELVLGPLPLPGPRQLIGQRAEDCRSAVRVLDLARYLLDVAAGTEASGPFDEKAALLEGILERLRDSTAAAGARLAVVVIPDQRFRDYRDHRRIELVAERAAEALGVPLLNLTEPLLELDAQQPEPALYDPAHGHWSQRGHAVAAERIAAFVRAHGLL